MIIHRQIRVGPIARDAEALELLTLDIHPAFGKLAAFLAEIDDIHIVLIEPLGAVLLLDLPLDRQAVAIPAGHIARVMAHHLMRAHDHIFDRLVQRVADMQVAVGIGGAVMQREGRAASGFRAQLVVDPEAFPAGEPFGLAQRQACAHREIGFGQEDGIAVIGGRIFGGHKGRSLAVGRVGPDSHQKEEGALRWRATDPATLTRQSAGLVIRAIRRRARKVRAQKIRARNVMPAL